MKKLLFPVLAFFALALLSCEKDSNDLVSKDALTQKQSGTGDILAAKAGCPNKITLSAGSVDALQDAVDAICDGGTITLATGMHTENDGVVISKKVTIKGEEGAVLKIQSDPYNYTLPAPMDVAIHFKNAGKSKLENLTIVPVSAPAGCLLLLENSPQMKVSNCNMTDFEYGILLQHCDDSWLTNNTIVCSDAWLTGGLVEAMGIININGSGVNMQFNDVSQGFFGIWPCGENGLYQNNYTHDNFIGMILCNVPMGGFKIPSGEYIGSEVPSTNWQVKNNVSQNNGDAGYLVIDGANNNHLVNNEGGNNGTYDIDLVGESYRFGFLTPTSHENLVNAGSFNVVIKDCGVDNTIIGGTLVDNSVDPCY